MGKEKIDFVQKVLDRAEANLGLGRRACSLIGITVAFGKEAEAKRASELGDEDIALSKREEAKSERRLDQLAGKEIKRAQFSRLN